jgi:Flp pilus assembly protein TadG
MMRFRRLSRLAGDEQGVSAVEFALLAPVLIFIYFGLVEFCQGFMAEKRMTHVSSMVADLVSQEEAVSTSNIDDIFEIGALIMKPFPDAPLQQRVSSVTLTSGVALVDWSRGVGGMSARDEESTVTLPPDLLEEGQSVIMAEAAYDYRSPIGKLLPGVTKFTSVYYLRPRTVEKTLCPDCAAPAP